jgi:hypothetical protein
VDAVTVVSRRLGIQVPKWTASSRPASTAGLVSRRGRPVVGIMATGAVTAAPSAVRQNATASAGAAVAVTMGADSETPSTPRATKAQARRGDEAADTRPRGFAGAPGEGESWPLTGSLCQARPMTSLTPAGLPATGLSPMDAALIAEACTKSNVIWVRTVGSTRHQLAWHAWHEGAVYVVYGVDEQMLPLMSGQVEVVVPSKDTGSRLVTFVAQADILPARSPEWEAAAAALSASRLNATDPDGQLDRWASGTLVTRLAPVHLTAAGASGDGTPAGVATPPGSPATTVGTHQPWHVRGRARARRALRLKR